MTDVYYGLERPDEVIFYPDRVAINTNIRQISTANMDGSVSVGWVAECSFLTTAEYMAIRRTELEQTSLEVDDSLLELAILIDGILTARNGDGE